MKETVIAAFYRFADLPDAAPLRDSLLRLCREFGLRGTLLVAPEGLNGTVSGTRAGIDALRSELTGDPRFGSMPFKESLASAHPFHRLKVRLKREIVSMGRPEIDPLREVGTYVPPDRWNELLDDPEVLVLDTRNQYEVDVGTFERAVSPGTRTFREFPAYVDRRLDPANHRRVAMFCTGGIRCEKATAYLLHRGFPEVYHLEGGILNYLERVPGEQSRWQGECFVFDNRVAVDGALAPGEHRLCHACRMPMHPDDLASPCYEEGVSCPRCHGMHSPEKIEGLRERQRQIRLARARNRVHLGEAPPPE